MAPHWLRHTIFFTLGLIAPASLLSAAQVEDRIVAIVNSDLIMLSEIQRELASERERIQKDYRGDALARRLKTAEYATLTSMIERKLQLQEAKTAEYHGHGSGNPANDSADEATGRTSRRDEPGRHETGPRTVDTPQGRRPRCAKCGDGRGFRFETIFPGTPRSVCTLRRNTHSVRFSSNPVHLTIRPMRERKFAR